MEIKTRQFVETASQEIKNPNSRFFLKLLPAALSQSRNVAMETFSDPDAAQAMGGIIRAESVARLPELLEEFEKNAVAAGATVFWARDSREANEYILALSKKHQAAYVTKGKSMVTEELGLNEFLMEHGIEAFETDLGEFIAQLLKRPPFHIVGPAINVPVAEIRDIFMEKIGLDTPTTDPVELGSTARQYLREKFYNMKVGITGINFAVARTGAIINVENEGNIRLNKSSPKIQVSVMTIEKVVPDMTDAMHLLRLVSRNATGQQIGAYGTIDIGPKKKGEIDGPEELHIIILDNGRSALYQDASAREILQCIRCGGCLNICPVFGIIGGYPYGWVYSGPMGQLLAPLLLGISGCHDHIWACTSCGACKANCPAGIDHPRVMHHLRGLEASGDETYHAGAPQVMENLTYKAFARIASSPLLWKMTAKMMRTVLNKNSEHGKLAKGPGPLASWLQGRDFPAMPPETFHDRWSMIKDVNSKQ